MNLLFNPHAKIYLQIPGMDEVTWEALRAKVLAFLNGAPGIVSADEVRALDERLADDTTWRQLAGDLELKEVFPPSPEEAPEG